MSQPLVVTRGNTKRIAVSVHNQDGQPYVVSGDEKLIFGVKKDPINKDFTKYSIVENNETVIKDFIIILTRDDYEANLGKYVTCIKPYMTADLPFGEYWYDIGLHTGVDDYYPIVECSPFVVTQNVTSRGIGSTSATGPQDETELSGEISIADTTETSALADERQARVAGDQALSNRINAEQTARQAADDELESAINSEKQAREAAINSEKQAREAADNTLAASLESAINAEQENREDIVEIQGDLTEIRSLISAQTGTLAVEIVPDGNSYSIGSETCSSILNAINSGFTVYAITYDENDVNAWALDKYNDTTGEKKVIFYRTYITGEEAQRTRCTATYTITPSNITYQVTEDPIPTATSVAIQNSGMLFTSGGAYNLKQEVNNNISTIATEIQEARNITDGGTNTTLKQSILEAIDKAAEYTDSQIGTFETFTIEVVDELPTSGDDQTFYLIPKTSGAGYEKWWYITDEDGIGMWDTFGASATVVVGELPTTGNPDIDYLLNTPNGCMYYKWVNGAWKIVAGSIAIVGNTLPPVSEGNAFADYYIKEDESSDHYVHYRFINGDYCQVGTTTYIQDEIDRKITALQNADTNLRADINAAQDDISRLDNGLVSLRQEITNLDLEGYKYYATYDGTDGTYTLYQYLESEGGEENAEVVSSFVIAGGGGGGQQSSSNIAVTKITSSPLMLTPSDSAIISFSFSSTDDDGDTLDGTYVWKRDGAIIMSGDLVQGINSFDMTEYASIGSQSFTLIVTDVGGSVVTRSWKVNVVDIRLETNFNDTITYTAGSPVSFKYVPYGANVAKTVHFKIDGVEKTSVTTSTSGSTMTYSLPAQQHGAHLVETWITARINNIDIETAHIFKDIMWVDSESTTPIISCIYRHDYYGDVEVKQFDTTNITYTVYDPTTNMPTISRYVDMALVSTDVMDSATDVWAYRTTDTGAKELQIACRSTHVDIVLDVEALDIDVSPVTAGLAFDFNPTGLSNTADNRLWSDSNNNNIRLSVSDNFDWSNGGYQIDADGNQYFCVKSGTRAQISYNMFETDPRVLGMAFKTIFKTVNVKNIDASVLSCMQYNTSGDVEETVVDELPDVAAASANVEYVIYVQDGNRTDSDGNPIMIEQRYRLINGSYALVNTNGLLMKVHNAYLNASGGVVTASYSENDVIEFDINIHPVDTTDSSAAALMIAYEDGVPMQARIYTSTETLKQPSPYAPIVIGSDDCDVHIYRMKAYSNSLEDADILKNFIADARDADTVINRYNRNQIYNENNMLTPESVANACPQLRVIKISAPRFTTSKKNFVKDTTVECIYKGGDAVLDNWKFENCYHAGQGTTSDNYGNAGRNIDIICCCDGVDQISSKITLDPNYKTVLTLGDGSKYLNGTGKVSLTRNSVPNNWFNIKVNIASSENANNALLQKRYNDFLPYKSMAQKSDPRVKNDMEFCNCVIFIRETDNDVTTHNEFNDTEWHFYAIGNIGDSKKTDSTRVNDITDMKEFCIEISDNTLQNSTFATGVDANGNYTIDDSQMVYPITKSKWVHGNPKYDALYGLENSMLPAGEDDERISWDSSFEFRYDLGGKTRDGDSNSLTPEDIIQQDKNRQIWRDFYEWVITSSDADFVAHLDGWFIKESALYWYLFTERYTMMDNRAKNTFWHFGKTGVYHAVPNPSNTFMDMYYEKSGSNYIPTQDTTVVRGKTYYWEYAFELWDYDNDTALGINNSGQMTIPYGREDTDFDDAGRPIFNGDKSTFWRRISKLFGAELRSMYGQLENNGCWSSAGLIEEFDNWQAMFPEELWRLDIERKYYRPTFGTVVDNSIVKTDSQFMSGEDTFMNGRKKYQRRQWDRDQEIYMATKYVSPSAVGNNITFRTNPTAPFTITITPYSDMYISVEFGNTNPISQRAIAGHSYNFLSGTLSSGSSTQVKIYQGTNISGLDNLSECYIDDNNFSSAGRLQRLIIGSTADGYSNRSLTSLNLGNNPLLEEIDVRNCPNLTGTLNLSRCGNLQTLYADGTALRGVVFAENGKISTAHLPSTINTLYLKNLAYLYDGVQGEDSGLHMQYTSLTSLTEENSAVDEQAIVAAAVNTLQSVNLVGINWSLYNTDLLNNLLRMDETYLAGTVRIVGTYRLSEKALFAAAWPDLTIDYSQGTQITQYHVTYVNSDEDETVLYEMEVDYGAPTPDPVALGYIDTPTKAKSAQYTFTYDGWIAPDYITGETTIVVRYIETINKYTVKWFLTQNDLANALPCYTLTNISYGDDVKYEGVFPVNTTEEHLGVYNVFKGWDKNTGCIKGDTNVVALWQRDNIPAAGTDLKDMTEAQLLAITKKRLMEDYFEDKDYIDVTLGNDFNFSDVESHVLVGSETHYNGTSSHTDFNYNLFGEGQSFTIAIDYQFVGTAQGTLVSCFNADTQQGFRLRYNGGPQIQWGDRSISFGLGHKRDMVVVRHKAGDSRLYIYASNGAAISATDDLFSPSIMSTYSECTITPSVNSIVTLGAVRYNNTGTYGNYGNGVINWCKVWMDDIGDTNAKLLAEWPREVIRMEYYGVSRYPITMGSGAMTNASFIANNLLEGRGYQMNSSNSCVGGYKDSLMRAFCNNRIYNAMPYTWKSLIKQVQLTGTIGEGSTVTNTSDNYIYLPAYAEMVSTTTQARLCEGELIPWMTAYRYRVKSRYAMIPENVHYFYGSTEPSTLSSNDVQIGDIWAYNSTSVDSGYKYVCVSKFDADAYGISQLATTIDGDKCWVAMNTYHLRSVAAVAYTTNEAYKQEWSCITDQGQMGDSYATSSRGVCICFSI